MLYILYDLNETVQIIVAYPEKNLYGEGATFIEFELNENYIIHIELSDENIGEDTTVEGISMRRKGWIYGG